jgi:hypothetical protein
MPILKAEMLETLVKTGASCRVDAKVAPRFRCGPLPISFTLQPPCMQGGHHDIALPTKKLSN